VHRGCPPGSGFGGIQQLEAVNATPGHVVRDFGAGALQLGSSARHHDGAAERPVALDALGLGNPADLVHGVIHRVPHSSRCGPAVAASHGRDSLRQ
jgi:hypothetical protein